MEHFTMAMMADSAFCRASHCVVLHCGLVLTVPAAEFVFWDI